MISTDGVISKIKNNDLTISKYYDFTCACKLSIKYEAFNEIQLWFDEKLKITELCIVKYLTTERLPLSGMPKDVYFNRILTEELPDFVLRENLSRILKTLYAKMGKDLKSSLIGIRP